MCFLTASILTAWKKILTKKSLKRDYPNGQLEVFGRVVAPFWWLALVVQEYASKSVCVDDSIESYNPKYNSVIQSGETVFFFIVNLKSC